MGRLLAVDHRRPRSVIPGVIRRRDFGADNRPDQIKSLSQNPQHL